VRRVGCQLLSVDMSAGPGSIPNGSLMLIQQGGFMEPVQDPLCLLSKGFDMQEFLLDSSAGWVV